MSDNDWLKYNSSEYTVNGITYRNLEAQVLKNKEDIEALERVNQSGVFFAEYNTTTFSEVQTALTNGLCVVVVNNGWIVAILTEIWKTGGTVTNYRFVSTLSGTEVSSFQIYDLNANDVWTTYQSTPMLTSDWGKETVVLLSTGWVSGGGGTYISQTVNIVGNPIMNSSRTVWVSPLNTQGSTEDYEKYQIICTGQGTGT